MGDEYAGPVTEEDLMAERELSRLVPLMQQAEHVRSTAPDEAWVGALRARMVEAEAPRPAFRRQLRRRLVGTRSRLPIRLGVGAAAALVVAAIVLVLALHPFGSTPRATQRLAFTFPSPTKADLTRTYRYGGGGGAAGGGLYPTISLIGGLPTGEGYQGSLHFGELRLSQPARPLSIYKLSPDPLPGARLLRLARRFGVKGDVHCMTQEGGVQPRCDQEALPRLPWLSLWRAVEASTIPLTSTGLTTDRLHSLAVSRENGELIYHDFPYDSSRYRGPPFSTSEAVRVARAWLSAVGLPSSNMPVVKTSSVMIGPGRGQPIQVTLGWGQGIRANVAAAVVWVVPSGRVIEAHLWPPVIRHETVNMRSLSSAWRSLASGHVPVAVEEQGVGAPYPSGEATASRVQIVQILVTPIRGAAFIEPVYRFSGTVHLSKHGTHFWYALVPAAQR